ncbi:PREDICTED: gibberellin 3-beta-dioxygenase 1-like [Nelumbo nucifera]|uniref:gibberellin 3beta-dioxygenase n=1 Tax=Nelumbo nucifera TaxID=4432 RepID=A0A1U7ZP85_NELNU|nr:PREDICTED: gibberellin 3-beta-dioxygenase 1-like [Nelumbo nucifera]
MSTSLSEAYRSSAHPIHLQHIIPLDFSSVRELPDSHAWTSSLLLDDKPHGRRGSVIGVGGPIPVIDLADANVVKLVGRACETWGVFQITNHGQPISLLEAVESESLRLFSLPAEQKLKALRSPDGATGYGRARITPFFSKLMWHEGFTIMGSPAEHAHQLWPHNYTRFCGVMDEYQKEMKQLSVRLLRLILSSLGLAREDLTKWVGPAGEFTQGATTALQLNSYPACPDPNRTMGLAAHTDTSMFTILYQSNTSGLQIFRDGFGWVSVPPLAGALIVNVGDLLQILSNARFPAVLHRAVVNRTNQRLSIAYFYGPSTETRIMPLSKLIGPGDPPLYRSLTWKEYIGIKAKHLYRALSLVRLQQLAPMNGSLDMNDQ